MNNQSRKTFENATIKLIAGDVNRIHPPGGTTFAPRYRMATLAAAPEPAVTEKAFDEFHLYSIARPTTMHDRETKQVEFVNSE